MKDAQGNRGWVAVMVAAIWMMLAATASGQDVIHPGVAFEDFMRGENPKALNRPQSPETAGAFPRATLTTLYSFCAQIGCVDGDTPEASLIQATDGNVYGTTAADGAYYGGTFFKISPAGALTTVYSFQGLTAPLGWLVEVLTGTFTEQPAREATRAGAAASSRSPPTAC
jgi:uncharacterized repeat protein (TIGR03803 family)